jgi:hypothetical protein
VEKAHLSIDVRGEASWHTEGVDKGLDTFLRHRVFGVESGNTTLHEESSEESGSAMTGLIVSSILQRRKTAYTGKEDELGAILLRFVFRDKLIGVCISKVQSRACSLDNQHRFPVFKG